MCATVVGDAPATSIASDFDIPVRERTRGNGMGIAVGPALRVLEGDGAKIALQVTEAAGMPKGVVVYMNGTAAPASFFDRMATKLAQDEGYTSYAISSRTGRVDSTSGLPVTPGITPVGLTRSVSTDPKAYADDLARVVELARAEHPGAPMAVVGTSLGGVIANYFNATRNVHGVPVVSMSPVVLDRFQPFADKLRLLGSTVSDQVGERLVASPMTVGRRMSSMADSPYNTMANIADVKVPVKVFRSVLEMNAATAVRGPRHSTGHTTVVFAGDDKVAWNPSGKLASHLWNTRANREVVVAEGAPHELSQETGNQSVLDAITGAIERHQR
jgi:alpha-beta hydrolase superfamily lysophospholipase